MLQEKITLTIVAVAFGYFVYSMYRTFVPKKGKEKGHSCAGCSSEGCSFAKINK
jgi:hypothetical protein